MTTAPAGVVLRHLCTFVTAEQTSQADGKHGSDSDDDPCAARFRRHR